MDEELSVEQLVRESERLRIARKLFAMEHKTYRDDDILAVVLGIEEEEDEES